MKYTEGDLLRMARAGRFQVIAHGCNCFTQMGAGIAKQIREQCPEAYMADRMTIPGDRSKLGTMTFAAIEPTDARNSEFYVANLYTQYDYSREKVCADYKAIRSCMKKLKSRFHDMSIGLPLIGAGLAGGDWKIIEKIIEEELGDEDVTIVRFKQ